MAVQNITDIKRIAIPICKKYDIPSMYLFGSYATGNADFDSDIDLVIDSTNLHGLFDLFKIKQELETAFGIPVDLLTLRSVQSEKDNPLKKDFFNHYNKERICLYEQ